MLLNVTHGLPLTLTDRKRAAERIAISHPQWSDRRIAAVTGVSAGTVEAVRRRLDESGTETGTEAGTETGTGGRRVGQDGRVRPLDSSTGRRLASRLLRENPNLSLRQVAQAAAISPETVRDVRNRLRSGAEIVPVRRGRAVASPSTEGSRGWSLNLVSASDCAERPTPDRATVVVDRLTEDPSLRYNEAGRNLLRLLTLHNHWTKEWDAIVEKVPPHCTDAVADLAREFACMWAELATRVGPNKWAAG